MEASSHRHRLADHVAIGTRLSLLSDSRLADAVSTAEPLGTGIGGRAGLMEVAGRRVFVKRVPLTELELRPENVRSTANMFALPLFYQYGIGSAGFGAWRELAAQVMTTGWVLRDEYAGFPLLHHWRVLADAPPTGFVDVFGGVDGAVAHWESSPAVRRRLEAIGGAPASLVLFLEHVPSTLTDWLAQARGSAGVADARVYRWVEEELERGTSFLSGRGMVHFDAHFRNLLTDGHRVYFADLGLALSRDFELTPQEAAFLADHLDYDRAYTPAHLLRHHLLDRLRGEIPHPDFLRAWVAGRAPVAVPPGIAALVDRHARASLVLDDFFDSLLTHSKRTPIPADRLRRALTASRGV
ncbi:hypothetical protein RKD23_001171 [Streptomyces sp. SAI-170]|uniref:protein kinase family protein n=1 Tax=Streptomyces sp. SAI-170 TaxID=3377729 RepID=UPI003C7981FF